ncbi:MAG: hypothetical protein MUO41_02285 [Methyloceanibacter sp.]|nr:hypothetical protein [Methyloceanibacter sp.]
MKKYAIASLLAFGLATPVFAANPYFVTVDTVGNCSVLEGMPSAGQSAIAETAGYASKADAEKALAEVRKDESKCKGVVE